MRNLISHTSRSPKPTNISSAGQTVRLLRERPSRSTPGPLITITSSARLCERRERPRPAKPLWRTSRSFTRNNLRSPSSGRRRGRMPPRGFCLFQPTMISARNMQRMSRRDFLRLAPAAGSAGLALLSEPWLDPRSAHAAPPGADHPELSFSLIDVAASSGLIGANNVFGGVSHKRYLLEETGCGIAFFDYDHDGWLDIFIVNGTRFEG